MCGKICQNWRLLPILSGTWELMWINPEFPVGLFTFIIEIINGKLPLLSPVEWQYQDGFYEKAECIFFRKKKI